MAGFTPITSMLRPAFADPIGVDQLKQRNALADREMVTREQNALAYQQNANQGQQANVRADQAYKLAMWAEDLLSTPEGPEYDAKVARIASDPEYQSMPGANPQYLRRDVVEQTVDGIRKMAGLGPRPQPVAPYQITTQKGPYGSSIVTDGGRFQVVEPPKSNAPAPVRPNWTKVDVADPVTGQTKVGFVDTNATNPEATFRPLGTAPKPASSGNPQSMRKEFDSQQSVQSYKLAFTQYRRATTAPDTRAGDISVVYALGKIFDPTSVVREGEIALSQNAQPWLQKIAGEINSQIKRTGRLDPATRAEIVASMRGQIDSMGEMYSIDRQRFEGYAKDAGFDPNSVVGPNLYTPQDATPPAAPAASKPGRVVDFGSLPP